MFDIYDSWSGCLWRDTRANQWERASNTYRMLHASIVEAWKPQKCHKIRVHHPYSFFILCFSLWNRTCAGRASWQSRLSSICFASLVTFDLTSLPEIKSLWNHSYNHQVCGHVVWSNRPLCAFRGLLLLLPSFVGRFGQKRLLNDKNK